MIKEPIFLHMLTFVLNSILNALNSIQFHTEESGVFYCKLHTHAYAMFAYKGFILVS